MPRILLVADVNLYGKATGAQRRLGATARGLARVGDVDYLQWGSRPWRRRSARTATPRAWPPLRNHLVVRSRGIPDRLRGVQRTITSWWPESLGPSDRLPDAVASAPIPSVGLLTEVLGEQPAFDLVWCFELSSAVAALPIDTSPKVVDIDAVPHLDREPARDLRHERRDRAAWERWIDIVAERSVYVTLANPAEAAQLALPNAVVVPNGCDVPPAHAVRALQWPPVFVFVGWMGYEANADAAHYLVREIVPALRQEIGDQFVVRVVGSAPPKIRALNRDPNVEVTGYVDDLEGELARSDIALVPVRRGAGTRIKVLEALAAQLPVVSTPFGAQGLSVVDGEHLLLAETPGEFARACKRLLADAQLRERLATRGYELVAANHAWPRIEAEIGSLAEDAITRSRT